MFLVNSEGIWEGSFHSIRFMNGDNIIAQFIQITNCDPEIARTLLDDNDWHFDNAVSAYFNLNETPESVKQKSGIDPVNSGSDDVRAPILPKTMRLVEDATYTIPIKKHTPMNPTPFEAFSDYTNTRSQKKERHSKLDLLFEPPRDITYKGPFEHAMEKAKQMGRYLLVNIQERKEFDCQKMNRDTWSNKLLKELIKTNFVFWQGDRELADFYCNHYEVCGLPHVAVIDPRTGESLRKWDFFIDADTLLVQLPNLLYEKPMDNDTDFQVIEKPKESFKYSGKSLDEWSEEEQTRIAIQRSLHTAISENTTKESDSTSTSSSLKRKKPLSHEAVDLTEPTPKKRKSDSNVHTVDQQNGSTSPSNNSDVITSTTSSIVTTTTNTTKAQSPEQKFSDFESVPSTEPTTELSFNVFDLSSPDSKKIVLKVLVDQHFDIYKQYTYNTDHIIDTAA
eukprot:TRINITY_DN4672_c0_g1_i3.p1 TRINITY_DN4672_c0_g1~~TRINITY_DN4672_c0_g1_i3.p1  ORF type:complete len:450 (+),score=48.50 TRINITY_DN4672_c0_g1_i3:874-2223(+)